MTRALPVLVVVLVACGGTRPLSAADMPADLAEVVAATLATVEGEAQARAECLEGLVVRHAWKLADRASYDPRTATITLRVPATAPRLEFTLVHEIAHHLEFTCPSQAQMRGSFLATQGLDPGTEWFEGAVWEEVPSEQFATAFAMAVTGGTDSLRRVPVSDETLALVGAWAKGEVIHEP